MSEPESSPNERSLFGRAHTQITENRLHTLGGLVRSKPPLTQDSITVVDQPMLKRAIGASALGNTLRESAGQPLPGSPPQVDTPAEAAETYAAARKASEAME